MSEIKDKTIFNCHTHIFTIDHVPNLFGKKLVPLVYQIVTMKVVKWYYLNLTRRSPSFRRWKQRWNKVKYFVVDVLKFTVIGYWGFSILFFVLKWAFKIVSNFLALSNFFGPQSKLHIGVLLIWGVIHLTVSKDKVRCLICWKKLMIKTPNL